MNYKIEKDDIAFNLLAMSMANNCIIRSRLNPHADKIALLGKENKDELLNYIKALISENMERVSFCKLNRTLSLFEYNEMFKKGQYIKAKLGYEKLIRSDSFYQFLKINVRMCNKLIRKG